MKAEEVFKAVEKDSEEYTGCHMIKEGFLEILEKDNPKMIQQTIDKLELECSGNQEKFIKEALNFIVSQALIHASETEAMPRYINHRLDALSEVKLADLNLQLANNTTDESDYKKLLAFLLLFLGVLIFFPVLNLLAQLIKMRYLF